MKYYKANGDYYDYFNACGVVPGELLTEKERYSRVRYLTDSCFHVVEVSKKKEPILFSDGDLIIRTLGSRGKIESEA